MIINSTLKHNISTTLGTSLTNSETNGAIIYIIVVLLWYSAGIVFMLGMQLSAHAGDIEYSTRRRTRFLIRNLKDQNNTKEILGIHNYFYRILIIFPLYFIYF